MSLSPQQVSSGTEGDTRYEAIDEKKKRRMISNRESARRSRKRKQQHTEDLIREIEVLQRENGEIVARMNGIKQRHTPYELENKVLENQKMELSQRLNYLKSVVDNVERNMANRSASIGGGVANNGGNSGFNGGYHGGVVGEVSMDYSDPMLRPWQTCCTSQPIMASASMFHF